MERPHPSLYQLSTTATTRINGWDAVSAAIGVSQTVYPAARPNAVVLARPDYFPESLAATRLLHPFHAPLLYTESQALEEEVKRELVRLSPGGNGLPGQVIVVGAVHAQILHDIDELGFTSWHLIGHDLWDTVDRIAELDVGVDPRDVLLVSAHPLAGGVVAGGYAAHKGSPILFATERGLSPSATAYLRRHPRSRVFVICPEAYLPRTLTSDVRLLGSKVEGWIGGGDPYEVAGAFAKFRHSKSGVGWGRRERSGAAVTLVPTENWPFGVAAAALSSVGKQTPLLLTKRESLPGQTEDFLNRLRPRLEIGGFPQTHGFLVGSLDVISYPVQMRMHQALTRAD
ncbi:cell wall-binding repeat-containing protein [Tumebacillus sp. DT12]|uniref:Cell wall-binding repeat-containing protein n=1 Tax=Tumebacillus lacus TaxID=2995335 RepID=A0ABT3WWQ0_9BACL|nr:cell wall-binding repeat-containing protein [Tumebacillus lacus]MCX7569105.1 cell wall-binding repeat-containing protein [Tumebacillus lacus]